MSWEIRADYEQQHLFPRSLEEWVPEDHPARFLREFVDSLDLAGLGFRERESVEGRPSYAPDLLLKVWLYGYVHKIRSTRALERACREHVSLLWLTGCHEPDHNTLWRFWRDNQEALRRVFGEVVKVSVKAGVVDTVLHAVDGTKVQSRGSARSAWHRKDLERLSREVAEFLEETETAIEQAEKHERGEYRLPEELRDREALRQRIQEALDELAEEDREHLHPAEPEAQMMKCEGQVAFAYNAQLAVDAGSGLIVGQDVVTAGSDNHQLVPMLEQVHEQVGQVAETTVADGGYYSGQSVAGAEQKGFPVVVNIPKRLREEGTQVGPYASSRFVWDAEQDVCRCPQGEELHLEREREKPDRGYSVREYRCQSFRKCGVRWECSQDQKGRRVEVGPYQAAVARHRQRAERLDSREALKLRGQVVEPVIGTLKEAMGFRRFTGWGQSAAQTQWALTCTAFNLKKLYRWWLGGQLAFG